MIPAIKAHWPEFKFIAEAYWDLEWELQQQGFDFCYDKKLYDRMEQGNAETVRQHLLADRLTSKAWSASSRTMTSLGRPTAFPDGKGRAAAVAILTLTGAKFCTKGNSRAGQVRLPVFLGRRPVEPIDHDLVGFL